MSTTAKKIALKWDTTYATYYWKIFLDPKHSRNNPSVEHISGYSKVVLQSEALDIDNLLRRKIHNLLINGYFPRMKRIEFWQRKNFCINKSEDPKILILYPTHYDIPEDNHDVIFKKHGVWLKEFYDAYLNNRSTEHLFIKGKKPMSNDEFLNIHRFNFNGLPQLYSHAARLLTHGHPEGAVNDFIRKYKELKQW